MLWLAVASKARLLQNTNAFQTWWAILVKMGLGWRNKVNIGKIRPRLWAESSLGFLRFGKMCLTQNVPWTWADYLRNVQKAPLLWKLLVGLKVRRVLLCWQLPAFILSTCQKLLSHVDSINSSPLVPCLSLTASMTFSTLLMYFCPLPGGPHYLGDDGQTGYCLHKVARKHVAKHPLRVLILCMPPPSTFSAWCRSRFLDLPHLL